MKILPSYRICCFVFILLVMSSCGSLSEVTTPQPVESPIEIEDLLPNHTPTIINTEPRLMITTAQPKAEIIQTQITPITPTKDLSYTNMPDKINTGSIWLYFDKLEQYYVYDFMTESFSAVKAPPPDCEKTPLINSLEVLCFSDGNASIYDLRGEVRTALSIDEASYVWQQLSIPELLFYTKNDSTQNEDSYYSYNLRNGESKYLITLQREGFETLPMFSPSIDIAVAVFNNEVIRINFQSGEFSTIFSSDEHATFNIKWSPTLPVIAFGATDNLQQEIGERANLIYLLDVETGNIEQLFPNGEMESYFSETDWWPIWSPSGDEFIAIAYERLLIIRENGEVLTIRSKTNTGGAESYPIGSIAWSPDGEHIAFLEYPNGFLESTNLVIYSMNENRIINVIENEEMSVIFWR